MYKWTKRALSILIVLLLCSSLLPIGLSPIETAKADAYNYDVYMHPNDLGETFYLYHSGGSPEVILLNFSNQYDYRGDYLFALYQQGIDLNITVNTVNYTPIYQRIEESSDRSIYVYKVPYANYYEVILYSSCIYTISTPVEVKSYFITQYQNVLYKNVAESLGGYLSSIPFYPRYSEYNFMRSIHLGYSTNIYLAGSDYIGSNVASNVSTRTIDDIGFHGAVYVVVMKNKTGSYPNTDGISVSTDLWSSAGMYLSSQFIVGNEYYKLQLYRLGYIDANPLSVSKDIELNITDSNPSASEHLLIANYYPTQAGYTEFYTYYYGYTDSVKTDNLINAYTSNDYYANLKVHVYDTDTGQAVSDALVELDGEPATWQVTDSLGDVFYDNIVWGVIRTVRVTHPSYPDWDGSTYISAGYNTLNVPLGAIVVDPETTLYTDAYWYDRYDTVTFTYNIAGIDWDTGDIYDIEVLKAYMFLGVIVGWSSYDIIPITQSQSGTANWQVTEQGHYKANLRQSGDTIVESNQFSVTETVVTPNGSLSIMDSNDVTITKSSFNISESIVLNVTDMNMEGYVKIRQKGFYPYVVNVYIPEDGLYNTTITYAGFFEATLEVVHLGTLVELDSEEFTVLEDKDFAYITILNIGLDLPKGDTVQFIAYSPETADVSIYNPNDSIVMSKQSLTAGVLTEFSYPIPANAIEGIYTIKLTNATNVELTNATFRVVGDIYNWVQWDKSGYWLAEVGDDYWIVSDSVVTSFSYANIYQGVKLGVYKMELATDGEWYISDYNSPLLELEYKAPKPSGQEAIEIGVEGKYRAVMWEYQHILGYWILMPEPLYSDMEVSIPEEGQLVDGKSQDPGDPRRKVTVHDYGNLTVFLEPWQQIFGDSLGKGMFAIMVIAVIDLTLAGAGIAMSVIGLMTLLMLLVFVWVGLLPLFIGVLLVILGSAQIVKMYTGK